MSLPFLDSDSDLYVNLGIIMIIIQNLALTKRHKLVLNNSKLHVFYYLIKNPVILNNLLRKLGKDGVSLDEKDIYSLNSISYNFDPLLDRDMMKSIILVLVSKGLIEVKFKNKDGFFYVLSEKGMCQSEELKSGLFKQTQYFCRKMVCLQSTSESELYRVLNQIIKQEL